jgi:hypothetical protein
MKDDENKKTHRIKPHKKRKRKSEDKKKRKQDKKLRKYESERKKRKKAERDKKSFKFERDTERKANRYLRENAEKFVRLGMKLQQESQTHCLPGGKRGNKIEIEAEVRDAD